MSQTVIEAQGLTKEYVRDEFRVMALHNASLNIAKGEFVSLMGPSGSGKSTLLHLIAAMDRPTGGEILVLGQNLRALSDKQIARWRNAHIGFVFQSFNLIPVLSALENVELPLKLTNLKAKDRNEHAATALRLVGLGDRLGHLPRQLSGGQEQRVAIARAIVTDPDLILADEPTGNLDATSAQDVLTLLSRLNQEFGKTIVMVTHDPHAARFATRTRYLKKENCCPKASCRPIGDCRRERSVSQSPRSVRRRGRKAPSGLAAGACDGGRTCTPCRDRRTAPTPLAAVQRRDPPPRDVEASARHRPTSALVGCRAPVVADCRCEWSRGHAAARLHREQDAARVGPYPDESRRGVQDLRCPVSTTGHRGPDFPLTRYTPGTPVKGSSTQSTARNRQSVPCSARSRSSW